MMKTTLIGLQSDTKIFTLTPSHSIKLSFNVDLEKNKNRKSQNMNVLFNVNIY